MKAVKLQPASEADIVAISQLAEKIWMQHYPSIISAEQISYMLEMMYSQASLAKQMDEEKYDFYFVMNDDSVAGFIAVQQRPSELFIAKYYIDQDIAGTGIGSEAFHELLALYEPSAIRLTVNRQNHKAVNFYFKNGFKIERVADFDIGNGFVMNDFVMVWTKKNP
jgi:diamine N-acetyltransferase